MGAVYRCRDLQLGRAVALKRILRMGADGAAGLERFRREAQAVASLSHRNIVTVHALAEDAAGPYLVMELLVGTDLGALVATSGALSVAEVLDIATQVGAALSYAHRRGIAHRDIKPSNLFRLRDGTVKVLDFGLARTSVDSALSQEGFGLGTIDYVSPEQRRDASRVDHRSDLFSLGATLYHLATGRSPRLVRERDLPEELRNVVLSLMEDRPEDRPFSVEEALASLQAAARAPVDAPAPAPALQASPAPPEEKPAEKVSELPAGPAVYEFFNEGICVIQYRFKLTTWRKGRFHWLIEPGQRFQKGDVLGYLAHPFSETNGDIVAPRAGQLLSVNRDAEEPPTPRVWFTVRLDEAIHKSDWHVFDGLVHLNLRVQGTCFDWREDSQTFGKQRQAEASARKVDAFVEKHKYTGVD
jgi:serine/threonine protein kinase